jgi:hypothetical protein
MRLGLAALTALAGMASGGAFTGAVGVELTAHLG